MFPQIPTPQGRCRRLGTAGSALASRLENRGFGTEGEGCGVRLRRAQCFTPGAEQARAPARLLRHLCLLREIQPIPYRPDLERLLNLNSTPTVPLRRKAGIKVLLFQKILWFVVTFTTLAACDSIELRNGRHLQGKFIGGTATVVGFMTNGSVQYFSITDVLALIFDNSSELPLGGVQPQSMEKDSTLPGLSTKSQRPMTGRTIRSKAERASSDRSQTAD